MPHKPRQHDQLSLDFERRKRERAENYRLIESIAVERTGMKAERWWR